MFGKKKSRGGVINTLVGEGTRIKGDLRFAGGCHVDGIVTGNVIAERDSDAFMSLSEQGLVDGCVRVPTVTLNGKVQGDVYASVLVQLGSTAKIYGNLHYELLEMEAGAEINGKLIHDSAKTSAPNVAVQTGSDVDHEATISEGEPIGEPAK